MSVVQFDCISIFPEMFAALTQSGVTRRALEEMRWALQLWNPRDFVTDNYQRIDDRPYGGGPGMVMLAAPLAAAIAAARSQQAVQGASSSRVLALSPQGKPLTHRRVMALAAAAQQGQGMILLCGRYEGIDERLLRQQVDEEIGVGDFVVSGGELPAMMLMDAIIRQIPGVLGDSESAREDSFADGLLDCPHYTRPEQYAGEAVPEVLLSGDHERIRRWRLKQAMAQTRRRRPELFAVWLNRQQNPSPPDVMQYAAPLVKPQLVMQLLAEIEQEEQCSEQ